MCTIFTLFPPEKFYFEIFSKTNAVSITFGLRYIHGQSLTEIDSLTRNAVDRLQGDSLLTASVQKQTAGYNCSVCMTDPLNVRLRAAVKRRKTSDVY